MYSYYAPPRQKADNTYNHRTWRTEESLEYSLKHPNLQSSSLLLSHDLSNCGSRKDMGNSYSLNKFSARAISPFRRNSSSSNTVNCRDKRGSFENGVDSSLPELAGRSKSFQANSAHLDSTHTHKVRRNSSDSGYNSSGKFCEKSGLSNGVTTHQLNICGNKCNSKRVPGDYNKSKDSYKSDSSLPFCNKPDICNRSGSRDSGGSSGRTSSDLNFSTSNTKPRSYVNDRSMLPKSTKTGSDGLVGLQNLGNTCFMNSILQCLSHCRPLRDKMLDSASLQRNRNSKMNGKLAAAFAELIKTMWRRNRRDISVSPCSFKTQIQRFSPRFVGYEQQDSQEFLRFLLEGLNEDLNQPVSSWRPSARGSPDLSKLSEREVSDHMWEQYKSRDNSLVTDLFCGQIKSALTCTKCNHRSVTYDPFWDLSLPIPRRPYSSSRSTVTLSDCLTLFTKKEELDGDEKPKCEKCKTRQRCKKQFRIQRFPRILVIHLKRFSGFGFRSKLQTDVEFPLYCLDMSNFADELPNKDCPSVKYNLFAVSNHSGSAFGGHYTAYCKHPESEEWHSFNDTRVTALSRRCVGGSQAYVLFYERDES